MLSAKKTLLSTLLLGIGGIAAAGLIDFGDETLGIRFSGHKFRASAAWQVFPVISKVLPQGLPRRKAWEQDFNKAAKGLNADPQKVQALLKFVLDPRDAEPAAAPCKELLEFELYARGRRELLYRVDETKITPSWQKLLAMPVAERRYTTVPVIYQNFRSNREWSPDSIEQTLQQIEKSIAEGCYDTQGCLLALINDVPRNPVFTHELTYAFKRMFRSAYANNYYLQYQPGIDRNAPELKEFESDIYRDLFWALYLENAERIRKMCKEDPAVRDMIVAFGLTSDMSDAKKVAWEFARQSKVNQLLLAMYLPHEEAIEVLKNMPEHQALRDQRILLKLTGKAKVEAIDRHIARFPEQTKAESDRWGYALLKHSELQAMAGAYFFRNGNMNAAAERWANGATAEDMALITEQVMSTEELIAFCNKYFALPVLDEQKIHGGSCAREYSPNYNAGHSCVMNKAQLNYIVRNILARRLMREDRWEEAEKYFTGSITRGYAQRFFAAKKIVDSPDAALQAKIIAALNMAALMRFHGDILYGTFLEPDNLICQNRNACVWGTVHKNIKLVKPDLPRYSYRYKAAEMYAEIARNTNDKTLQAHALWTAGTILKYRAPALADKYFKKLYAVDPSFCGNNWFKPFSKVSTACRDFYLHTFFTDVPIGKFTPPEPVIRAVELPANIRSSQDLYKFGAGDPDADDNIYSVKKLFFCSLFIQYSGHSWLDNSRFFSGSGEPRRYALKLAGDQGIVEADIYSALMEISDRNYLNALWFIKRADRRKPNTPVIRYLLGQLYFALGYAEDGNAVLKNIIDDEKCGKEFRGDAAYTLACFYYFGVFGMPEDRAVSLEFMKKAADFGFSKAFYYTSNIEGYYK